MASGDEQGIYSIQLLIIKNSKIRLTKQGYDNWFLFDEFHEFIILKKVIKGINAIFEFKLYIR